MTSALEERARAVELVEARTAETLERELVLALAAAVDGRDACEGAERVEVIRSELRNARIASA